MARLDTLVGRWLGTFVGLLLFPAGDALAAVVELNTDVPGCTGYVSGTGECSVSAGTVDVTWALQGPETINGYDLEIRWDPSELELVSATQLFPDTGSPQSFLEAPLDPADSRAAVFSLTAAQTTSLFRLRFAVTPHGGDGGADLSWFPNGSGLAGSVTLENATGAAIDFVGRPPAVPTLSSAGAALCGLLLGAVARRQLDPARSGGRGRARVAADRRP